MIFEHAFCQILRAYEEHMAEKFDKKQAKKGNFNKQMEFRKKSISNFLSICYLDFLSNR